MVPSTYKLHKATKMNLQALAFLEGKDQSDIVREALDEYLRRRQIDPTRPPRIEPNRL
ncbi:MAG TPA: hypothetical protein VKB12_16395 [Pyrinomonadaceae bacterium]|nr:hypothetical protein [Pyrinomonadaceae bacterium]